MKKTMIALLLSLCSLVATGCAADLPAPEASRASHHEVLVPWTGADGLAADEVLPDALEIEGDPSAYAWSCTGHCSEQYDECLASALDSLDECLCYNAYVSCRRGCGKPGLLRRCSFP